MRLWSSTNRAVRLASLMLLSLLTLSSSRSPVTTTYSFYVGNLHSHTSYSDGVGTPAIAFAFARDTADIDFLAITDHHNQLTEQEYSDVLYQSDVFTEDGVFVAIAGQEWTMPAYSHMNIFQADHIFAAPLYDFEALYSELLMSGCTATFNHPHEDCFDGYAYSEDGDSGVNSVEVRRNAEEVEYIKILNNGWHVGADGSQDNHDHTWGILPKWTVALAPELTRGEILRAHREHRTYSTRDRNLWLTFKHGEHWLGESFSHAGNLGFTVAVEDDDPGDEITRIVLFQNGMPAQWKDMVMSSYTWFPEISPPDGSNYYFVKVYELDGAMAWSSPMWIDCGSDVPPTPILSYPWHGENMPTPTPTLGWYASENHDSYTLQYSSSPTFVEDDLTVTVSGITDTCYTPENRLGDGMTYYWRVQAVNDEDSSVYSAGSSFTPRLDLFNPALERRLTWNTGSDVCPCLCRAQDRAWLAWSTDRAGNPEVYYKISSDSGQTWSNGVRLTDDPGEDSSPSIAGGPNGDVWVVWHSDRCGSLDIYCKVYEGLCWSGETNLTQHPGDDRDASILKASDGRIWMVWSSNRDSNYEIRSMVCEGVTWSEETRLTDDPSCDWAPDIVEMENGDIWVVWATDRDGHFNIYRMVWDGSAWGDAERVTDCLCDETAPSVEMAVGGAVWLAYERSSSIFYTTCLDSAWSDEALLTDTSFISGRPSVTEIQEGELWIVYSSAQPGDDELYARITHCTGVSSVWVPGSGRPGRDCSGSRAVLFQNRPNPFRSSTAIEFSLPRSGCVELSIYDTLGREIRNLVDRNLGSGHHSVYWDGTNSSLVPMPSGVYFYELRFEGAPSVRRLVLLK